MSDRPRNISITYDLDDPATVRHAARMVRVEKYRDALWLMWDDLVQIAGGNVAHPELSMNDAEHVLVILEGYIDGLDLDDCAAEQERDA